MMEKLMEKNECDYVNVLEVADKDNIEECVCCRCGVSYFRVIKGSNQSKSFCKKCFYDNKRKRLQYTVANGIATFTTHKGDTFTVDEEDAERVAEYTWWISTSTGYVIGYVNKEDVALHRFLFNLNSEDKVLVDHMDFCKVNNCKSNLRLCTNQENLRNTNAKGYRKTRCGTYQARIAVDGKEINLGCYATPELANAVRIIGGEKVYFGEFSPNADLYEDVELLALYEEAMASIEYLHKNKARVDGDVVYVTVSGVDETKEFVIDSIDYDKVKDFKWYDDRGQIKAKVTGEKQSLARFLMGLTKGDNKIVRFIDKNNLNFKRENLQVVKCKSKTKKE